MLSNLNALERALYKTHNSVIDAIKECEYNYDDYTIKNVYSCTHCGLWALVKYERIDADGNQICRTCQDLCGY